MPGLRVGGAAAGRAERLAARAEHLERRGQARFDHLALAGEPGDRLARFVGADIELAPFFLVARPLVAAQRLAAGEPIELLAEPGDVQLVLQHRLVLPVALAVETGQPLGRRRDRSFELGDLGLQRLERGARAGQLGAEVADLAPRRQDAVAVLARSAHDEAAAAAQLARPGDDRNRRLQRQLARRGQIVGHPDVAERPADQRLVRADDADDGVDRLRAVRRRTRLARDEHVAAGREEAAAAGAALAHEGQPAIGVGRRLDQHALQQVAERRFDGTLAAGLDLEVVGHRSVVGDAGLGRAEHQARRFAVGGAARLELLQRSQARFGRRPPPSPGCARRARANRARPVRCRGPRRPPAAR